MRVFRISKLHEMVVKNRPSQIVFDAIEQHSSSFFGVGSVLERTSAHRSSLIKGRFHDASAESQQAHLEKRKQHDDRRFLGPEQKHVETPRKISNQQRLCLQVQRQRHVLHLSRIATKNCEHAPVAEREPTTIKTHANLRTKRKSKVYTNSVRI
jgi:hypothetical protein